MDTAAQRGGFRGVSDYLRAAGARTAVTGSTATAGIGQIYPPTDVDVVQMIGPDSFSPAGVAQARKSLRDAMAVIAQLEAAQSASADGLAGVAAQRSTATKGAKETKPAASIVRTKNERTINKGMRDRSGSERVPRDRKR